MRARAVKAQNESINSSSMANNPQRSFVGWTDRAAELHEAAPVPSSADGENGDGGNRVVGDVDEPATAVVDAQVDPASIDISSWTVYVVDAHSLIFQVFHAIPEMTSPRGEHVAAVYGFVRDMLQIIEQKKPDALI